METLLICAVLGVVGAVLAFKALIWGSHHVALCVVGFFGALIGIMLLHDTVNRAIGGESGSSRYHSRPVPE